VLRPLSVGLTCIIKTNERIETPVRVLAVKGELDKVRARGRYWRSKSVTQTSMEYSVDADTVWYEIDLLMTPKIVLATRAVEEESKKTDDSASLREAS
jgi:hypothetical protein